MRCLFLCLSLLSGLRWKQVVPPNTPYMMWHCHQSLKPMQTLRIELEPPEPYGKKWYLYLLSSLSQVFHYVIESQLNTLDHILLGEELAYLKVLNVRYLPESASHQESSLQDGGCTPSSPGPTLPPLLFYKCCTIDSKNQDFYHVETLVFRQYLFKYLKFTKIISQKRSIISQTFLK